MILLKIRQEKQKTKRQHLSYFVFKEEFHLLHGQVLVLKNRTFHQKVLSKNGLIRELRSISKFVTLQNGMQIITINILPDISKSKDNQ